LGSVEAQHMDAFSPEVGGYASSIGAIRKGNSTRAATAATVSTDACGFNRDCQSR
jgi:hypothetical protein